MSEIHVEASWRVSVHAKYLGPTDHRPARIRVRRGDHLPSDPTLTVGWDDALSLEENYVAAIREYLVERDWTGTWVLGSTADGYVAVNHPPTHRS